MTQSPSGGTASPNAQPGSPPPGPAAADFGATTMSGSTASATATDSRPGGGAKPGPPQGAPVASTAAPPAAPQQARGARNRGPRRARLQLRHISPLTVLKFSCVLAIALFFVWLIVVGVLFGVLDAAGVIGKINDAYTTIQGANSKPLITSGVVFGGAAIIGLVNIVLFIALSTIGSIVYNLCADLVGGIEITLSER
jgi:hypothetical protein